MHKYFLVIFILISSGCEDANESIIDIIPDQIDMICMDIVSMGGTLNAVIRTQQEYEEIIEQRFDIPLQTYWDGNYESVLSNIMDRNPGLSAYEYEEMVREVFYTYLPFRGTDECEHPTIDFGAYTLLGVDAGAGGCEKPEIEVQYTSQNGVAILSLFITTFGSCEAWHSQNIWVLVPKISENTDGQFEKEYGEN